MIDRVKMLKLCAYIVGGGIAALSVLFALSREWVSVAIMLAGALLLILPCALRASEKNLTALATYLMVGVNLMVFIVGILTGNIFTSGPFYMAAGTISILFFSTRLVVLDFSCGIAFYILECVILSLRTGSLIEEPLLLGECLFSLVIALILVRSGVKSGVFYLEESAMKQKEAEAMSAEVKLESQRAQAMMEQEKNLLENIIRVASHISNATAGLSGESENLASGATEQAASVEQVSATLEDFSGRMRKAAELAKCIREDSKRMDQYAGEGDAHMDEMLLAVKQIERSMSAIETINKTVNDIAFQTNILALNAAVEAARAGAAGKGFAVVADEVRTLAGNSAKAAEETVEVLDECRRSVEHGAAVAEKTSATLKMIKNNMTGVTEHATDISTAAEDQLNIANMIAAEIEQVSGVVQNTAASAEQVAASVKEISAQAEILNRMGNGRTQGKETMEAAMA